MTPPSNADETPGSSLLSFLPDFLTERARWIGATVEKPSGDFVLYWMRTAVRADENPALDLAIELAEALDLPVWVYHGLSERYPFASDRHHSFILEGARDVAPLLARRGIGYACHLERPGADGPYLRRLADRAAVLVTEDMPVAPLASWTASLATQINTPVVAVDTSCVVPMNLVPDDCCHRAFAFRRATAKARNERVGRPWPAVKPSRPPFLPDLPFEPIDLAHADFAELIGQCRIDHTVGPVAHTPGGSTAGYRRWQRFKSTGLKTYARRRNNALLDGVSRMSAYLHYGMVSPFRLAREAHETGSDGAKKYLDELMIWRELAYAYCFHRPGHADVRTLPDWALDTLEAHQDDPREHLPTWEELARAKTGDPLWDAAQTSLLRQGELHNNVRMTWGKALIPWTPNPQRALKLLEDLNHRYALDGRDPASYGGILWCLGEFDRPFPPAKPIWGTVRPRSTSSHARRLDVETYGARVSRSPFGKPVSVMVVGAGMAGLACARTLSDAGLRVTLLDKGRRGPGGRLATRRHPPHTFDHGAQFFTARRPVFRRLVESWHQAGLVDRWPTESVDIQNGRTEAEEASERWVGRPKMSAVAAHLASDLDLRQGVNVTSLKRAGKRWQAQTDDGAPFEADLCVVTAPAVQSQGLLGDHAIAQRLAKVEIAPCIALMASFAQRVPVNWQAAALVDSPLSWIARDSSKPGRPEGERWVLHGSPEWSRRHLEDEPETWIEPMLEAFEAAGAAPLPVTDFVRAHRWRFARVTKPLGVDHLFDADCGVGYAGDACLGSRVEDAFLSGCAVAGAILRSLAADTDRTEASLG